MPLDADAKALLDMVKLAGRPEIETLTPDEAREMFRAAREALAPEPMPIAELRDLTMPGPDGGHVRLRLYRPRVDAVLPALVFFHGGGWVIGDVETHDTACRHLAVRGDCAVVSVDYRLAPEHKFPAAVDDCLAATRWVVDNAAGLDIDPARLAVGGDSAGGNLAAVVSLLARDQGGPQLRFQMLLYPALDAAMPYDSINRYAEGYLLTRAGMRWFYDHYARTRGDIDDWRMSPLRAADLAGLPSAFVLIAGYDPLRDEGEAYARRLQTVGGRVTYRCYAGQIHGFMTSGRIIREAAVALDEAAVALADALR
jgi:acetyl esterase